MRGDDAEELAPSPQTRLCPILIGRESATAALDEVLLTVRGGSGRVLLLAGEAGIGKSRVVSELRARAASVGVQTFQGDCFESDRTIPYAPITELFRNASGATSRSLLDDVGDQASRLSAVLPELAPERPDTPSVAPADPAGEQRRVFDALVTILARAARRSPVVVIVEDLHWADESSLSFLLFAVRRLSGSPIAFIFTYRPDEAAPDLLHACAEIERGRLGIEIRLAPLTPNEVDLMVRALFDLRRPTRPQFVSFLFGITDGNPFFVEEVLKSATVDRSRLYDDTFLEPNALDDFPVPRTVADAVQRRLRPLTSQAKQVVSLAAVAGRQFDFEVLRIALAYDDSVLLDAMRELIAAQLVVEESADRFYFRHALTRQAVFADLLGRERRSLHQTLFTTFETLAASGREPPLADLAYHSFEAGLWAKAVECSQRAGDAARALCAPNAAIVHYTRACAAAASDHALVPLNVIRERGLAYRTVGNFGAALADFEAVLVTLRAGDDREAQCQALIELGFHWSERDYAKTHFYFNSALSLARQIGNPVLLAATLNRLGNWHMNQENPEEALRLHREALALFEAERDQPGIADSLGLLAMTTAVAGDLAEASSWFARAIEACRAGGDRAGTVFELAGSAICCSLTDMDTFVPSNLDLSDAIDRCEEALGIAREIGLRSGEAFAGLIQAHCLLARGSYERALAVGRVAEELADEIAHHQWLVAVRHVLGRLFLDLFEFGRAREYLEPALALARKIDSPFWVRGVSGFLASVAVAEGALDEAEHLLDLDLPIDSPMVGPSRRICWCARGELALARARPAEALTIADRLLETAGGEEGNRPVARLWRLRADALLRLRRTNDALDALNIARAAAEAQGLRPLLWRIDEVRATVFRVQHRYVLADEATVQARATIGEVAPEIPDDLRFGFVSRATARLSAPSTRRIDRIAHDGLTSRETEVAVMIGHGLTNRLIAESLVLSEHTVETHVRHILSKLGVGSRAQVAAWASRKELLRPH